MYPNEVPQLSPAPHNVVTVSVIIIAILWAIAVGVRMHSICLLRRALETRRIVAIRGLGHRVRVFSLLAKNHLQALVHTRQAHPPQPVSKVPLAVMIKPTSVKALELEGSVEVEPAQRQPWLMGVRVGPTNHAGGGGSGSGGPTKQLLGVMLEMDCKVKCAVQLLWDVDAGFLDRHLRPHTRRRGSGLLGAVQSPPHTHAPRAFGLGSPRIQGLGSLGSGDAPIHEDQGNPLSRGASSAAAATDNQAAPNPGLSSPEGARAGADQAAGANNGTAPGGRRLTCRSPTRNSLRQVLSGRNCGKMSKLHVLEAGKGRVFRSTFDDCLFELSKIPDMLQASTYQLAVVIRPVDESSDSNHGAHRWSVGDLPTPHLRQHPGAVTSSSSVLDHTATPFQLQPSSDDIQPQVQVQRPPNIQPLPPRVGYSNGHILIGSPTSSGGIHLPSINPTAGGIHALHANDQLQNFHSPATEHLPQPNSPHNNHRNVGSILVSNVDSNTPNQQVAHQYRPSGGEEAKENICPSPLPRRATAGVSGHVEGANNIGSGTGVRPDLKVGCLVAIVSFSRDTEEISGKYKYKAEITKQLLSVWDQQSKEANLFALSEVYGMGQNNSEECVVCLTERKVYILLPCRHLSVCNDCFRHIDKCPQCRSPFDNYIVLSSKDSEEQFGSIQNV